MKLTIDRMPACAGVVLIAILSVVLLASFSNKPFIEKKQTTCDVSSTWNASVNGITGAGIDWCNGADGHGTITAGNNWTGTVDATGCSGQVGITTVFGGTHPSGTVFILKNGTQVASHSVNRNQSVAFDDFFTASCGDVFTVNW